MLEIKATHSQIGMLIEARQDGGEWQTVQLTGYRTRQASPSVMAYRTCINPLRDEQEYFEDIDRMGIAYRRVAER